MADEPVPMDTAEDALWNPGADQEAGVIVYTLLKTAHPELGVSVLAMNLLTTFMIDTLSTVGEEACRLATYNRLEEVTAREIRTAVRLMFPKDLAVGAIGFAESAPPGALGPTLAITSEFTGTHVVPALAKPLSPHGRVYLSACAQHALSRLLRLAGDNTKGRGVLRVTPKAIQLAVEVDESLNKVLSSQRKGKPLLLDGVVW